MPIYVYGCENNHRIEVEHSIRDDPVIICDVCGSKMWRVPQSFRWYMSPTEMLLDTMDENYRKWKVKNANKARRTT